MAKDGVTGEDMVIYMPYYIRNDEDYLTISKKQFREPVMVDGKLIARYKRQTKMRIEQDCIDILSFRLCIGDVIQRRATLWRTPFVIWYVVCGCSGLRKFYRLAAQQDDLRWRCRCRGCWRRMSLHQSFCRKRL